MGNRQPGAGTAPGELGEQGGLMYPGPGGQAPPLPGQQGGIRGAQTLPPATKFLRIVLITTDGVLAAEDVPVPKESGQEFQGWTSIYVPLDEFKRLGSLQTPRLKRIIISGDADDEFYIARIRLVSDDEPMRLEAVLGTERTVQAGQPAEFRVVPDTGLSIVKYRWNFGDGSPVEETDDPVATHTFKSAGDYTVTVQVIDTEGKKKPASLRITVHVIP